MSITFCFISIAMAGAIGGFVSPLLTGERGFWPRYDEDLKVWRPGWLGNLFMGAIAAVVIWPVYGPLASFDLNSKDWAHAPLTLAQLGSSVIVGLSGGKVLTSLAQQSADRAAKSELTKTAKKLNKSK